MAIIDTWFAGGCLSRRAAAKQHGYSTTTFFNLPAVKAYVAECFALRQAHQARSEAEIIREFEKIGFASMGDLLEIQPDGTAFVDMTALTPDMRAAISEYQVETYNETQVEDGEVTYVPVKKTRVKFHDKKAALEALARIHGMNKDKVELTGAENLISAVAKARARLQTKVSPDTTSA